jgi:hypothetical protein
MFGLGDARRHELALDDDELIERTLRIGDEMWANWDRMLDLFWRDQLRLAGCRDADRASWQEALDALRAFIRANAEATAHESGRRPAAARWLARPAPPGPSIARHARSPGAAGRADRHRPAARPPAPGRRGGHADGAPLARQPRHRRVRVHHAQPGVPDRRRRFVAIAVVSAIAGHVSQRRSGKLSARAQRRLYRAHLEE